MTARTDALGASMLAGLDGAFAALPRRERWFVRGRLASAPLAEMANLAPSEGPIADIGCGHGALSALLALGSRDRRVTGIDPDPRKIAWAKAGPGRLPNLTFAVATVEEFALTHASGFATVIIADVLYLLPPAAWPSFLEGCRALLVPGGRLLLKEAEANGSWKHRKCELQEQLMVRVLRRTKESGALSFHPRAALEEALHASGFRVTEVRDLSRGYSTPHVLFIGERT